MLDPKISIDGNCPSCTSDNWKLAKKIVSSGTTIVDTESEGGGLGISVGIGQGYGGVGINYQNIKLDTNGTHTTVEAAEYEYIKPLIPYQYNDRFSYLPACLDAIKNCRETIEEIDRFAFTRTKIRHAKISNYDFTNYKSSYDRNALNLYTCAAYEVEIAWWDKLRICCRCGESFVTEKDNELASSTLSNIPQFSFDGEDRTCPKCSSYIWKAASLFFDIRIRELRTELQTAHVAVANALNITNKPQEGGLLKQLWSKVEKTITESPESAQIRVNTAQRRLENMLKRQDDAAQQYSDLMKVRVCVDCEKIYQLGEYEGSELSKKPMNTTEQCGSETESDIDIETLTWRF